MTQMHASVTCLWLLCWADITSHGDNERVIQSISHITPHVFSYYSACILILLCMYSHITLHVFSHYSACILILLRMYSHITPHVFSYYSACILILLRMYRHRGNDYSLWGSSEFQQPLGNCKRGFYTNLSMTISSPTEGAVSCRRGICTSCIIGIDVSPCDST